MITMFMVMVVVMVLVTMVMIMKAILCFEKKKKNLHRPTWTSRAPG